MPKLVQKCGYIKGGDSAGYMKYIATREGVEKLHGRGKPTKAQQLLIRDLLREFPDSAELFEYEDYRTSPSISTASAFITMAIDSNAHSMQESNGYMQYIATRPHVEKRGDHGLFGGDSNVDLKKTMQELENHTGNVWTIILSLRREDAARLGYDSAVSWRTVLMRQQVELADAMKIPLKQLRWYAAFHNEGHHPHVHVMVWSDDPKQGYLTVDGIRAIRSKLTNDIFQDELHTLYEKKDVSYKELTGAARSAMAELVRQMESSICASPVIEQKLTALAESLETVTGKKVYGYLKKPVKEQINDIVDELAKLPEVSQFYEEWNRLRDELEGYYKSTPRVHLPLSQQKEFRAIKNMVIQEAENIRLGAVTFEDADMEDEPEEMDAPELSAEPPYAMYDMAKTYRAAKELLCWQETSAEEKQDAVYELEQLWNRGFTVAAHQLGKCWRNGLGVLPDQEKAELWFRRSADAGNDYSQYALGKLLEEQGRIPEAVAWYEEAAKQENQYACYRLGKLYLLGEDVPKNTTLARNYLLRSAWKENQYAQYVLGKLYLMGENDDQDLELAKQWFTAAAEQGNTYAQFFLDRMAQTPDCDPNVLLSVTRLLHQVSNICRQNTVPPANPEGPRMESKRRKKLMQKRLAMGHKVNDHEDPQFGMTMR